MFSLACVGECVTPELDRQQNQGLLKLRRRLPLVLSSVARHITQSIMMLKSNADFTPTCLLSLPGMPGYKLLVVTRLSRADPFCLL